MQTECCKLEPISGKIKATLLYFKVVNFLVILLVRTISQLLLIILGEHYLSSSYLQNFLVGKCHPHISFERICILLSTTFQCGSWPSRHLNFILTSNIWLKVLVLTDLTNII